MKISHLVSLAGAGIAILLLSLYAVAWNAPVVVTPPQRPPIPKKNGFPLLVKAASALVLEDDVSEARLAEPRHSVFTLAEKQKLVLANRAALQLVRAALRLPYVEENTAFSLDTPNYKPFRSLTRTLTLAGDVDWEEGRQSDAVDFYLDAVTLGRRMPNRTRLEGQNTGLVCETIARSYLWRRLPTMDGSTAERCLVRLNALEPERVPLAVSLAEEKYSLLSWLKHPVFAPESPSEKLDKDDVMNDSTTDSFPRYGDLVPQRYIADTLAAHLDKLIAQSKQPYCNGNPEIEPPGEPITRMLAPMVTKTRCKYTVVQAGDALLRTALAIRVYTGRTGNVPASLSELVTARLLPRVPDDPFATPGTPLRYTLPARTKPSLTNIVLYSVGPDGVDDQGRGIEAVGTKGKMYRNVNTDSQGDIVAGWANY